MAAADSKIAVGIIGITVVVIVVSIYLLFFRAKSSSDGNDDANFFGKDKDGSLKDISGGRKGGSGAFLGDVLIPVERQQYLDAKLRLDHTDPSNLSELKKLLMRRAIASIPYILKLQQEGDSVERLYKRGMLTDHMHDKVKDLKGFVDSEYNEIKKEAEVLAQGWADQIWPQARRFQLMIAEKNSETNDEDESTNNTNDNNNKNISNSSSKNKKKSCNNKFNPNKYSHLSAEEKAERIGRELIEEETSTQRRKGSKQANK